MFSTEGAGSILSLVILKRPPSSTSAGTRLSTSIDPHVTRVGGVGGLVELRPVAVVEQERLEVDGRARGRTPAARTETMIIKQREQMTSHRLNSHQCIRRQQGVGNDDNERL